MKTICTSGMSAQGHSRSMWKRKKFNKKCMKVIYCWATFCFCPFVRIIGLWWTQQRSGRIRHEKRMNEWMNECFYYRVIKNWLQPVHTTELKKITKKLKQNAECMVRSPWRQSGWSPVGSPVGRRGSVVGRICGTGEFLIWNGRERKWWMVWWWWQMMKEVDGMKQEDYC